MSEDEWQVYISISSQLCHVFRQGTHYFYQVRYDRHDDKISVYGGTRVKNLASKYFGYSSELTTEIRDIFDVCMGSEFRLQN